MPQPQNYANHARRPPPLFLAGAFLSTAATLGVGILLVVDFSAGTLALFVVAACTAIALLSARRFATGVQDRVIRLEERLRLERLLPDDLKGDIGQLTTDQLIALRFASDAELPGLVRRVLAGELTSRDSIKQAVEDWRPDHQRI
ncbi:MAG: DUF6526 family protein [Gemmatimonadota bacterium]|uniref:DUF6526 family protein n=1 Tax=Candidatus Palauibacter scopulicola TaxID=3056741 RepID=UPI002385C637|nr:DUF6526 family protein [Candidatus Palauibacter scopulicola]MDE2662325.1 DUF6526 family protein [Candidatus Palauibacter scopulicola]